MDKQQVFSKAMENKSVFYKDYDIKREALESFIDSHNYPLSETDSETLKKLHEELIKSIMKPPGKFMLSLKRNLIYIDLKKIVLAM